MTVLLALDFGGTKLAAAIAPPESAGWLAHDRVFSAPGATAHDDLREIAALARRLLNGQSPAAIGVSFGGPANFATGVVRLSHHVPGWENIPLQAWLEAEFHAPTRIDNDANAGALGEHRYGAGQGVDHLLYITVSTGVGGGWILNGQPWRGAHGLAGEIGHMTIDPHGPVCLCGKRGCVERLASGPYLATDLRDYLTNHPADGAALRARVNGDLSQLTARSIAEAAEQGDDLAASYLQRAGWALGVGIGNATNLINPQRVLLGGGVTKSGAPFWDTLRQHARATALPEIEFDIHPARHIDDAPLYGALALAHLALG